MWDLKSFSPPRVINKLIHQCYAAHEQCVCKMCAYEGSKYLQKTVKPIRNNLFQLICVDLSFYDAKQIDLQTDSQDQFNQFKWSRANASLGRVQKRRGLLATKV